MGWTKNGVNSANIGLLLDKNLFFNCPLKVKNTLTGWLSGATMMATIRQFKEAKLAKNGQSNDSRNDKNVAGSSKLPTRRGFPLYETNPSIASNLPTRIRKSKPSKLADAYMVVPGTGQVVASGTFGFVEEKEVDAEEFVKIYLAGIRQYGELTKAGALLFEYVYHAMSGVSAKDRDTVAINTYYIKKWKPDITVRTYNRGLHELLEKEFLFRSPTTDIYFVNVRFMFNGDRIALVQSYRRKANGAHQLQQQALPLDESEDE